MAFKKYLKKQGKRVYNLARKRYMKNGSVNVQKIVKDVNYLKSVLNPEKKRNQQLNTSGFGIAQCFGATGSGIFTADITPIMSQGTTAETRNGASIKLHSSHMKFQFRHQASAVQRINFCMYVVSIPGQPYTASGTAASNFMNLNQFVLNAGVPAIIDYNSDRNQDYFKHFRVLRKVKFSLQQNDIAGQSVIKNVHVGLKYKNHHIKFNNNSNTIAEGQLMLFIFADSGNSSATTASTLSNVPVAAVNTGAVMNYDINHYFYDN